MRFGYSFTQQRFGDLEMQTFQNGFKVQVFENYTVIVFV